MSISIGGINLVESIVNLEFELNRTQRILDLIIQRNKIQSPSAAEMKKIDEDSLAALIVKYPEAGINAKKKIS